MLANIVLLMKLEESPLCRQIGLERNLFVGNWGYTPLQKFFWHRPWCQGKAFGVIALSSEQHTSCWYGIAAAPMRETLVPGPKSRCPITSANLA